MANVIIDNKVREYLLKKGGIITIEKVQSGSCWTPRVVPGVRLGEPESKDRYNFYDMQGINIYINKGLIAISNTVEVKLFSFLGMKILDASGFKMA